MLSADWARCMQRQTLDLKPVLCMGRGGASLPYVGRIRSGQPNLGSSTMFECRGTLWVHVRCFAFRDITFTKNQNQKAYPNRACQADQIRGAAGRDALFVLGSSEALRDALERRTWLVFLKWRPSPKQVRLADLVRSAPSCSWGILMASAISSLL